MVVEVTMMMMIITSMNGNDDDNDNDHDEYCTPPTPACCVSGSRFRVSVFGFRLSNLEFRISGSGFRHLICVFSRFDFDKGPLFEIVKIITRSLRSVTSCTRASPKQIPKHTPDPKPNPTSTQSPSSKPQIFNTKPLTRNKTRNPKTVQRSHYPLSLHSPAP